MAVSKLLDAQMRFTQLVARLIDKAGEMGYGVTLGDAYRDPRVFGPLGRKQGYGHPRSAHKYRLAIDLNLYKDGAYLALTEDHKPLGEWWESQGGCWGGRFNDGNHYSFEWNGIR